MIRVIWLFALEGVQGGDNPLAKFFLRQWFGKIRTFTDLPIYRDALALAVHLETVVAGFSRYHKLISTYEAHEEHEG